MSGERRFVCYFWFIGWDAWSLGLSVCLWNPNIEIHLPTGFIRIGWIRKESRPWPTKQAFGIR